ncbi:YlaI family protein [Fervidibacillus halotolerans]|uniref:YlaI family protein n=1 Tax=Fervidibacillus halotolerans TaxID=2980027 RepID=A0A9E8M111_9BACI|nr:YlaI family protein [Fervidibacillus halotolerans]WAA13249.1 YlaI family protein [Fervidibacillus halotolerans]
MRVQCVICDRIEKIEDYSPLAKKLRNRPIHTYMCDDCNNRIRKRTEERLATGKFRFFRSNDLEDDW